MNHDGNNQIVNILEHEHSEHQLPNLWYQPDSQFQIRLQIWHWVNTQHWVAFVLSVNRI